MIESDTTRKKFPPGSLWCWSYRQLYVKPFYDANGATLPNER